MTEAMNRQRAVMEEVVADSRQQVGSARHDVNQQAAMREEEAATGGRKCRIIRVVSFQFWDTADTARIQHGYSNYTTRIQKDTIRATTTPE